MVRGLSARRRGGAGTTAWTDLGGAVLLHPAAGPDPQVLEWCADLAARHEPTLVFLDLPPAAAVRERDAVAACLADRPGELRLVPVGRDRAAAASLAEWLSHLLNRAVLAPDGDAVEVADGWFVPAAAGAGWTRYAPGHLPVAHSRRLPTPRWEGRPFAEPRDLGGGVRVEPLPAGAWITGPGAPQAADSLRKWLTGGLQMDPGYPRVVVGHPGPASVPLAAVWEFWEQLDERTRPMVRFAEFGATDLGAGFAGGGGRDRGRDRAAGSPDSVGGLAGGAAGGLTGEAADGLAGGLAGALAGGSPDPADGSFGQALADLFATPVVAATGVPVLAPWGSGGSRIRVLLPNGAMHWRPYVWDLRYLPREHGKARDPEPVGYRAPIDGLAEVSSGVYEYAPGAVLEVTRSGLWMRPPDPPHDASSVRAAPIEPGRSRVFHAATGTAAVADRMRRLAAELLPRLETEVRKLAEVLPSTAAITLIRAAADPAFAAREALDLVGDEAAGAVEAAAEEDSGVVAAPAEATLEEPFEAAAMPVETAAELASGVVAVPAEAIVEESLEAAAESTVADIDQAAAPAPTIETPPVAEPVSTAPPIGRISLESGPRTLDIPLPSIPAPPPTLATATQTAAPAASALAPGHAITPTQAVASPPVPAPAAASTSPAAPAPDPVRPQAAPASPPTPRPAPIPARAPTPAPAVRSGARVQPVPSAENTAVPPARTLDLERQWLRRNLGAQYDATVGSVARILSEFPGLRAGGAPTADVLVDLVAVQLYLSGHTRRFDDLVRSATAGPHVPLARCVAAGLRRLPSHRGPVLVRAELTERDLRWYGGRKVVTEWAFVPCVTGGRLRLPGRAEVLIWSMTARRTHLVAPEHPDQAVFLPGTSFKVLSATAAEDGPRVLLRELSASEVGADGRVEPGRVPLDDVALAGLTEAGERWRQEEASEALPESLRGRFGSAPGLIVADPDAGDPSDPRDPKPPSKPSDPSTTQDPAPATRPPAAAPGGTAS